MPAPDALATLRDRLTGSLVAHLERESGGPVAVDRVEVLAGGACQDNWLVEARFAAGPLAASPDAPGAARRLVLRSDPRTSLPASLDRRREFEVVGAAVVAGVRTPPARRRDHVPRRAPPRDRAARARAGREPARGASRRPVARRDRRSSPADAAREAVGREPALRHAARPALTPRAATRDALSRRPTA